jgi:hypothetical protein
MHHNVTHILSHTMAFSLALDPKCLEANRHRHVHSERQTLYIHIVYITSLYRNGSCHTTENEKSYFRMRKNARASDGECLIKHVQKGN